MKLEIELDEKLLMTVPMEAVAEHISTNLLNSIIKFREKVIKQLEDEIINGKGPNGTPCGLLKGE